MEKLQIHLYKGFIFDAGYSPFVWSDGCSYLPTNKIFLGKLGALGHEILELALVKKKGKGNYHCEKEGCILHESGAMESCPEHQTEYDKINKTPFELSMRVYENDGRVSRHELDSHLERFREVTGITARVADFTRIKSDVTSKCLLLSRRYCGLTSKRSGNPCKEMFRLLPLSFAEKYGGISISKSTEYLFPLELESLDFVPVEPGAYRRFLEEGLRKSYMTIDDVKLRKKIIRRTINFDKHITHLLEKGLIELSDENKKPLDKNEAIDNQKRRKEGYNRTLQLLEGIS
jgi:hypothetical protein